MNQKPKKERHGHGKHHRHGADASSNHRGPHHVNDGKDIDVELGHSAKHVDNDDDDDDNNAFDNNDDDNYKQPPRKKQQQQQNTDTTSFAEHRGKPHPQLEGVLSRDDSFDELLRQTQDQRTKSSSPKSNIVPMSPLSPMSPKKKMARVMDYDYAVQYADENLGEDFESTPWMPPSLQKATDFKRMSIYHGGATRIDSLNLTKVDDLGSGVILYFQFAMTMSITLGIMSLLSLPLILFTFYGEGVPEEERDGLGMYRYALGNIGYQDPDNDRSARCTAARYGESNTCIRFWGSELTIEEAAGVITAMEVVSIVVFFIGALHLYRSSFSVSGRAQRTQVSISDYAVEVHGIPPDCSDVMIMKHFSDLYALDKVDWRGRPPVEGAESVRDCNNTGEPMHLRSWVAECALHKGIGHFIASFKTKQHLMEKLFRCRARMKMYAENSPHTGGHREARYLAAEKDMLATGAKIDRLTEKTMKKRNLKVFLPDQPDGSVEPNSPDSHTSKGIKRSVSNVSQISNSASVYRNIDAPAVSVFIVFQYQESKVRCLDDYEKYSRWRFKLNYPQQLLFRGHKLRVAPAVEPDRILWENLEISFWEKLYRRVRTFVIAGLLVLACFIIILALGAEKTRFAQSIPSRSLCADTVPELYLNKTLYDISLSTMQLKRPDESDRQDLDKACQDIIEDSFYVQYFTSRNIRDDDGNINDDDNNSGGGGNSTRRALQQQQSSPQPEMRRQLAEDLTTDYSFDACRRSGSNDEKGLCPNYNSDTRCPCASTSSTHTCKTKDCFLSITAAATAASNSNSNDDNDDDDGNSISSSKVCDSNERFEARAIGACYCYAQLTKILRSRGAVETQDRIDQQREDGACTQFFQEYSRVSGFTVLSIFVTASMNVALRAVLVKLSQQERHSTTDEEHGSIISKIFATNYVTMGILVLLAYGKWENAPSWMRSTGILNGPYADFNSAWYGNIGYYLLSTFILQSFGPLAMNLLKYYVLNPFKRFWHHRRVRELKSTSIVMQNDLNRMEVGPIFDPTIHTAQLLTLLFFAMTYAPGLPLLMPLCCFTFVMYFRIDKMLLCRFYQKPPQVGSSGMKLVIQYLPYAALIRMAFAIWMFANYRVLPNDNLGNSPYANFLRNARGSSRSSGINRYIFRENVFPIFVLFLIVAFCKFLIRIWKFLPIYWLLKCFKCFVEVLTDRKDLSKSITGKTAGSKVNENGSVHPWEVIKMNDPRRQHVAPFTGDYFRYVKNKDEIPDTCLKMFNYYYLTSLTEIEVEEGWEIRDEGDFLLKVKAWKNQYRGSGRKIGDLKKTYEVIGDKRVCTYNVEKVPAYIIPMQGLKEGTSSMIEFQLRSRADRNVVDTQLYEAFDAGAAASGNANMESNVVAKYIQHKEHRRSLLIGATETDGSGSSGVGTSTANANAATEAALDAAVQAALRDGEENMRKQKQQKRQSPHQRGSEQDDEEYDDDEEQQQPNAINKKKPGQHHSHHHNSNSSSGAHGKYKPSNKVAAAASQSAPPAPPAVLESADSFFSPTGLVPEKEAQNPGLAAQDSWSGGVSGLV